MRINVHSKPTSEGTGLSWIFKFRKNASRRIFRPFHSITNLPESAALLQVTAVHQPGIKLPNFIRIKLIQWDPTSFQRLPEFKSLKYYHSQILRLNQRGKLADCPFSTSWKVSVSNPGYCQTWEVQEDRPDAPTGWWLPQPARPFSCSFPLLRTTHHA